MSVNNAFDASRMMVVVYSPEGERQEISRLNALDLVRHSGYSWKSPDEQARILKAAEAVDEALAEPEAAPEPEPEVEPSPEPEEVPEPDPLDPAVASLTALAERIIGEPDVRKYLEGFTANALRDMAEERYGQKIHHRTGKASIIDTIATLEEEQLAQSDA